MGRFQYIGYCIDLLFSCTDQELQNLGFLPYIQSLRRTTSQPEWLKLELYFQTLAGAIERKKGRKADGYSKTN